MAAYLCQTCFRTDNAPAAQGDVEYVKLTDDIRACARCGDRQRLVVDYEIRGVNPGMKWLMKNSSGWKEFK